MAEKLHEFAFTESMKTSLVKNRVYIVSNLNVEALMDYLVAGNVFTDREDVYGLNDRRKEKVRAVLDALVRRPAADYWTFIKGLYGDDVKQGNIAECVLSTYQQQGGKIPQEVAELRQENQDHLNNQVNHPAHLPQSQPPGSPPNPQLEFQSPNASHPLHSLHDQHGRSLQGNVVTTPEEDRASQQLMEVDTGDQRQNVCSQFASGAGRHESRYDKERRKNSDGVYQMDSRPRGLALIIDNEIFDKPVVMPHREGSSNNQLLLKEMLENLGFEISVKENLNKQAMLTALRDFSRREQLREVHSCVVAVMSHGAAGAVIFGVDGDLENGKPKAGTYITETEMRDIFSSTSCPALSGKPKFFIVQACRGGMEDTNKGLRQVCRDVVHEDQDTRNPPANRNESNYLDMCWAHGTVEGLVAYRDQFIPKLSTVFNENAATLCFKEMMTKLVHEMSKSPIEYGEDKLFMAPEDRSTLRKKWYFNPPPSSA